MSKKRKAPATEAKGTPGHDSPPWASPADVQIALDTLHDMHKEFLDDAAHFGRAATSRLTIVQAIGHWMRYPHNLGRIGDAPPFSPSREGDAVKLKRIADDAAQALEDAHNAATRTLIRAAEAAGIGNPGGLARCADLLRRLFTGTWKNYATAGMYWPGCLADVRYTLDAARQAVLNEGEDVLARLDAGEDEDVLASPEPAEKAPNWSTAMSKASAARLLKRSTETLDKILKQTPAAVRKESRQFWQFDRNHPSFARLP